MSRCTECGFDWDAGADEVIEVISRFGTAYRDRLESTSVPPSGSAEQDLCRARPSPKVWSALEYTAHMRDVFRFYLDRIDRVLAEDRPVLAGADFSSMADARRYRDEGVAAVIDGLDGAAATAAMRLRRLGEACWMRVGVGSEGGERTVLTLARRLAHDGHHHLMDIDRGFATLAAR